jgi:hypothetical protein
MNEKSAAPRPKPDARVWIGAVVVLIAVLIIGMAIYSRVARFSTAVKKELLDADAGFKKATNTIDAEALRAWALESAQKRRTAQTVTNAMPKEILTLYSKPPDIEVYDSDVKLSWGGGFFSWFFIIGNTNDTLPFHSSNQEFPYNFEWRPGIYYTREANQQLQ